ncbi:MAG: hypothetical protein H7Y27_14265, partial [Gemmatimonadaceae bacterium]|nr:hypothetical protein [Chitinophagaceae bacterium]
MSKFRITTIFPALLLISATSFSQAKPKQNDKPPTQKEMAEMMKEMEQAMKEMSPAEKRMLDSMGVKMPKLNDLPKMSDKQLAAAYQEGGTVIPAKKTTLIASLPKNILSSAALTTYIKNTDQSIALMIKPEAKNIADKIRQQFEKDKYYGAMIASAANGLWTS